MIRRIVFPVFAFMLLLYASCVHSPPKTNLQLKELKEVAAAHQAHEIEGTSDCDYNETVGGVTLQARKITQRECKRVFGHNLVHQGSQPVQLFIYNNTPDTIVWRPSYLDLPLESTKTVSKGLSRNAPVWAAAIGFPIYWLINPYLGIIAVPLTIYTLSKKRKKKAKMIHHNTLNNQTISLPPYTRTNKFIFVKRSNFRRDFEIKLFNEDKKKLLRFEVEC
ncbi:hypothetical protein HOM50_01715 [bacterium]|jgi:hypothetical protein|nr:hypothetical protein [bacterium]MBT5015104.1 hypothetical protein [bacterium]